MASTRSGGATTYLVDVRKRAERDAEVHDHGEHRVFAPAPVRRAAQRAQPDDDRPERRPGRGRGEHLFADPLGLAVRAAGGIACADRTLGCDCAGVLASVRRTSERVGSAYKYETGWGGMGAREGNIDQVAQHAKAPVKDTEG